MDRTPSSQRPTRLAARRKGRGRLLRLLPALLGVGALALFHAALLWERLADLSLLDPPVAARWAVSLLLLVGLWRLRRAGVPLLWGRRALVFWLVVLLVHVGVPSPSSPLELDGSAEALLVLPVAVAVATGLLLVALGQRSRPLAARVSPRPLTAPPAVRRAVSPALFPRLFSRPPPARAARARARAGR